MDLPFGANPPLLSDNYCERFLATTVKPHPVQKVSDSSIGDRHVVNVSQSMATGLSRRVKVGGRGNQRQSDGARSMHAVAKQVP
jgi:hypothetical protein